MGVGRTCLRGSCWPLAIDPASESAVGNAVTVNTWSHGALLDALLLIHWSVHSSIHQISSTAVPFRIV